MRLEIGAFEEDIDGSLVDFRVLAAHDTGQTDGFGFISDEDVGLGDVIKRATAAVGVRPCGSCEQRAAALNRWLTFSGRRPK